MKAIQAAARGLSSDVTDYLADGPLPLEPELKYHAAVMLLASIATEVGKSLGTTPAEAFWAMTR